MSLMKKILSILLIILLSPAMSGETMSKQAVTVELFYSSAWHNVTTRVYMRDRITINHGAGNEQTGVVPSDASLTFDGRDGEMNPENRSSSLFGLIGRNTPIRITVGSDIRFSGQVVSWKPRRAIKGDSWVYVQAQGTIRRLGQGEPPVQSALYQTITRAIGVSPAEYWPLESGGLVFTSVTSGSVAASFFDPLTLAQSPTFQGFPGSQPSVVLPADGTTIVEFPVAAYTDTGEWAAQTAWVYTSEMAPDGSTTFDAILSNGRQVHLFLSDSGGDPLTFTAAVTDDVTVFYSSSVVLTGTTLLDQPISLMMSLTSAAGGTLVARLLADDGTELAERTTTGVGYGTVGRLEMSNIQPGVSDTGGPLGVSHAVFYTDPAFDIDVDTVTIAQAMSGFSGETAGDRFERLCGLENITATIVGTAADTQPMGPQRPGTVLDWFGEIARTDAGIIHDTRDELGLTFRTGRSLYNQ